MSKFGFVVVLLLCLTSSRCLQKSIICGICWHRSGVFIPVWQLSGHFRGHFFFFYFLFFFFVYLCFLLLFLAMCVNLRTRKILAKLEYSPKSFSNCFVSIANPLICPIFCISGFSPVRGNEPSSFLPVKIRQLYVLFGK